jgi:hypothetical protein
VTAQPEADPGIVAWATTCAIAPGYGNRPVAGQVNFNPAGISTSPSAKAATISTVLHEMVHILGFSNTLFKFFVDKDGLPMNLSQIIQSVTLRGVTTNVFIAEPVLSRIRNFIGCPTYPGLELENQGGSGSKGSHWERRILLNELMTSSITDNPAFSEFTMGLLEASGWYMTDYSYADKLTFGRNLGCDFVEKPCINDQKKKNFDMFCDQMAQVGCTYNGRSKGSCAFSTIPADPGQLLPAFDYFQNGSLALDSFSDNCPYITRWTYGDCTNSANELYNGFYRESWGVASRCFEGDYVLNRSTIIRYYDFSKPHTGCHTMNCELKTDGSYKLNVMIGNSTVICEQKGTNQTISGYIGGLICPDPQIYCNPNSFNQFRQ